MGVVRSLNRVDAGRLIAVPIFAFLMVLNLSTVFKDVATLYPVTETKAFGLIHHLLIIGFYALVILLYFLRRPAGSTSKSLLTNSVAIVASFIPFVLPFLGEANAIKTATVLVADLVIVSGMVLSIYALVVLGKSFSIIPQTRKLVRSGPYRLIRHPLYSGELISVLGLVLVGPATLKIVGFFLLVLCQIYRAYQEEKLLANVFPEYEEYRQRTGRFIPGIF